MEEYILTNEANIGPQVITRLSPPTIWDMHSRGTIINVIIPDPYEEEMWIQRSSDANRPLWEKI